MNASVVTDARAQRRAAPSRPAFPRGIGPRYSADEGLS